MNEAFVDATADAREAATLAALLDSARHRRQMAYERSPAPPRFLLESAQSMAAHMAMPEQRMLDCLEPMTLWQLYLPSALGTRTWDFDAVREHLPASYARVRAAMAEEGARPQLVTAVFHMPAFPLICILVGAAWEELRHGPSHVLVADRNLGWFRTEANRWIGQKVTVLSTSAAGLREMLAGLKAGSIRRMVILADGPQPPGAAGTLVLGGISPRLGIKKTLLSKVHELGIPLAPITHEWEGGRLSVAPCPVLDPHAIGRTDMLDAVAGHIEGLLRRRPEQWLNWGAARIRT
jgi:hypothetical protein